MKRFNYLSFAVLGITLFSLSAGAEGISDEFRLEVQRDIERVESEGPSMSALMAGLREAGASYLPELVAPADDNAYQDPERRRMMTGVYLMDLTYATTFYQNSPAAHYGQALARLLDQLGFPRPDLEREYRDALENIDQPDGEEQFKALLKRLNEDTGYQEMLKTEDGMDVIVDGLYGFLVEALYLTAETTVLSDYNPAYLKYINDMRESFLIYRDLLLKFERFPELAEMVEKNQRIDFITQLLKTLGDLDQVDRKEVDLLRPIIVKARNDIVH